MPADYTTHYPELIDSNFGLTPTSVTAGGGNDGSEITGVEIDRTDFYSGVVAVPVTADLAEDETVDIDVKVQDAAETGGTYEDYATADTLTLTGGTGGTTETGLVELDLNLQGAKKIVQIAITATHSAASTDTSDFAAVFTLAGSVTNPV